LESRAPGASTTTIARQHHRHLQLPSAQRLCHHHAPRAWSIVTEHHQRQRPYPCPYRLSIAIATFKKKYSPWEVGFLLFRGVID
jgi:hypothetical protein